MVNLFRNKIGPGVLNDLFGYTLVKNNRALEENLMSINSVHAWIFSCVNLLIVEDYRGDGLQKEFKEMILKYVELAT